MWHSLDLRGIAQAFLLAEEFLEGEDVCLILGDNIFYGQSFIRTLQNAQQHVEQQREVMPCILLL